MATPVLDFSSSVDEAFSTADTPSNTPTETQVEAPAPDTAPEGGDAPVEELPAEVSEETEIPEEPLEETPPVEAAPVVKDKEVKLPESRYRNFEAAHKLTQDLEVMLGVEREPNKPANIPALMEEIKLRNDAFTGQQEMLLDFLSGDPKQQSNFVNHFLDQAIQAGQRGEINRDPVVPFASEFMTALAARHPEAYAAASTAAIRQAIDDLYLIAAQELSSGREDDPARENLFNSLQHIEYRLFKDQPRSRDAVLALLQDQNRLDQRNNFSRPEARDNHAEDDTRGRREWHEYIQNLKTSVDTGVRSLAETALSDIKPRYEKYPGHYEAVLDGLNRQIHKKLDDPEWKRQIQIDLRRARMSPYSKTRAETADLIVRKQTGRARAAIEELLPRIRQEANQAFVSASKATHERREAAQGHRAPPTGGTAPRKSLVPKPDSNWNPDGFSDLVDKLLPS